MSRLYFHSPSAPDAELSGAEHHWLGGLVRDIAVGTLNLDYHSNLADRLRSLLHPNHYLRQQPSDAQHWRAWASAWETAFRVEGRGDTPLIQIGGRQIGAFALALNTAALLGGDALKLATRLYGQCEIHAWVDGPNRAWLADIMQGALDTGIYRRGLWHETLDGERKWTDLGWDNVITLLRTRDDEPVVTSYSVIESFPNSTAADCDEEEFHALDPAERWSVAMAGLRTSTGGLELRPDNWDTFRFEHCLTVLDLLAYDHAERFRHALFPDEEPQR